MSNSNVCNEIVQEMRKDALELMDALNRIHYTWATLKDIEQLAIAKRRLRLTMSKLSIPHGGQQA